MQRLILFRHGKAEAESDSGDDFDRRLKPSGVSTSAAMGRRLAAMGVHPDLALVSSAARTRETWAALAESFSDVAVTHDKALYLADARQLAAAARAAGEGRGVVMIVAHNPGLQELTIELMRAAKADPADIARAHRAFPPATAAVFLFDAAGQPVFDGLHYPDKA